jgi:nicotinate-nucleotide pyrophosphorylase (carboxylating)
MIALNPILPPFVVLDPLVQQWLMEDIGRGDRTTQSIFSTAGGAGDVAPSTATWVIKESGVVAGLAVAARVFQRLDAGIIFKALSQEGQWCERGEAIATITGSIDALLMGERVALNLAMRLSGIATATRKYVDLIADLPTQLVDTRKTTPGLRLLEKYASQVGGAVNHRMGLDDAVMIKDNHIAAAGSIDKAIALVRAHIPYPLTIEVETETLAMVTEALDCRADVIMLDNMPLDQMQQAVAMIRERSDRIKIEASGNITLATIRAVAETGVDYISSSAPITRSPWLDLSMRIVEEGKGKLGHQ